MLAAIDLHGCQRSRLADPDTIRRFVPALIDAIGMRAHGPLRLDRFGDDELQGWSAMQFIETSSITIHADETWCRCFIDIFSCKPFAAEKAAAIAVAHVGGSPHRDCARAMTELAPVLGVLAGVVGVADARAPTCATSSAAAPDRTAGPGSSGASWQSSSACPNGPMAHRGA